MRWTAGLESPTQHTYPVSECAVHHSHPCINNQLGEPAICIHDRFDQQSEALELSEIEILDRLIEAAVDPLAILFLIDREVLIERFTPDAVSEAVIMQELSRVKLQSHAS